MARTKKPTLPTFCFGLPNGQLTGCNDFPSHNMPVIGTYKMVGTGMAKAWHGGACPYNKLLCTLANGQTVQAYQMQGPNGQQYNICQMRS